MAGWPIYRIGQAFRQPVFSLPKCPSNLSLSSLVLLCVLCCCCMFCCRHTVAFSCEQLSVSFRSAVQCCHPKFSPFSGFTFTTNYGTCSYMFSEMTFWKERTGPTDKAKIIHSFVWLVCGNMHKGTGRKEERGVIFQFQTETNFFFFFQNFHMTWRYSYLNK